MRDLLTAPGRARPGVLPTAAFAVLALAILASAAPAFWVALTEDPGRHRATDFDLYMAATRSWLSGLGFYHPYQLSGPYEITPGDILYPPVALLLFVPFTVLPAAVVGGAHHDRLAGSGRP